MKQQLLKRLISIFFRRRFDPKACILILRNRQQPLQERDAAAESLLYSEDRKSAVDALYEIIQDPTDEHEIRMSCATTLGAIFNETSIDADLLDSIEPPYKQEVLAEISRV